MLNFKIYFELRTPIKARDFKTIGCYAGMLIAQGGPGFPVLADVAYHYMTSHRGDHRFKSL